MYYFYLIRLLELYIDVFATAQLFTGISKRRSRCTCKRRKLHKNYNLQRKSA